MPSQEAHPPLRVLVIGAGGREHALAHKLEQSARVQQVFVAPGNGGTQLGERCRNVDVKVTPKDGFEAITHFAVQERVNLVVPGPEQPLVDGVEAAFRKVGIPVFGPSPLAARMEGSKSFSKDFMARHSIPTAAYRNFTAGQGDEAKDYVRKCGHEIVLKASGLAAGKGVLIPESLEEAEKGIEDILVNKVFGDAGDHLVIEEKLIGQELSVLAFSDGYTILTLPGAQDHKRIGEDDTGPNTGGMGAYAPAPVATPELQNEIERTVLQPTIAGMRKDGFPFVGMLFVGLMCTEKGPKVLEYNVRFGDPETEAVLQLLDDETDLAEVLLACAEHRLDSVKLGVRKGHAVSIVLASKGYPAKYPVGIPIRIGKLPEGVCAYHAGTALKDGQVVTAGGRVLVVSAAGPTLKDALALAYKGVDAIEFDGKTFRRDIAHRALSASAASTALTYASAGVSIDTGNELVQRIKPAVKSTRRPGCDGDIGGFGGVFDLAKAGFRDPVLVSGTDGVGTKLMVAHDAGKHDTVGIDLVAMSVNDLLVQGAEPLYFLDYFGCARLSLPVATSVIEGVAEGCRRANCALIGGETAEMPGMYDGDDYDLAGFAVGAVEREELLPSEDPERKVMEGDVLLGLASSGIHSNGFSLVRKVVARAGVKLSAPPPWSSSSSPSSSSQHRTLAEALLEPTHIYVRSLLPVLRGKKLVKAMSHITGGGFVDNLPRVLPPDLGAWVDARTWTRPEVFSWLQVEGGVEGVEMARTFNNGIGMVLVVSEANVDEVVRKIKATGLEKEVYRIGAVKRGEGVEMRGLEAWN